MVIKILHFTMGVEGLRRVQGSMNDVWEAIAFRVAIK